MPVAFVRDSLRAVKIRTSSGLIEKHIDVYPIRSPFLVGSGKDMPKHYRKRRSGTPKSTSYYTVTFLKLRIPSEPINVGKMIYLGCRANRLLHHIFHYICFLWDMKNTNLTRTFYVSGQRSFYFLIFKSE